MNKPTNSPVYEDLKVYLDNYFIMSTSDMRASKAQFFNGLGQHIHAIVKSELAVQQQQAVFKQFKESL